MSNKKFEIGKAYEYNCGLQMFICGIADTVYHGTCFIAEKGWQKEKLMLRTLEAKENNEMLPSSGFNTHELTPISMREDAMQNWFEIPKQSFIDNNTCN